MFTRSQVNGTGTHGQNHVCIHDEPQGYVVLLKWDKSIWFSKELVILFSKIKYISRTFKQYGTDNGTYVGKL
jgi:hypothetical protein